MPATFSFHWTEELKYDKGVKEDQVMAKVKITETVLRDAHQSLIATRMTTDDILPVVEKLDEVGYHSLECWGGATFDSCLRFLNEDPWERLRKIRSKAKRQSCRCC